jgi:hypothetical protein
MCICMMRTRLIHCADDQGLSAFFFKARQIVLPDDFERNIWQLLLKFAKTLRAEAGSKIESEATHVKI